MSKTLIIGPSQAGKTVMLASLRQAATNPEKGKWTVDVDPKSKEMRELLANAQNIVIDGVMPVAASDETREYSFELRVRRNWLQKVLKKGKYASDYFVLLDGPGGVVFGNANEGDGRIDAAERNRFRELILRTAQGSDGIIICIDASDDPGSHNRGQDSVSLLFRYLGLFLDEIGEIQIKRLAICLNKAEKHFMARQQLASSARNPEALDRAFNRAVPLACQHLLDAKLPESSIIAYGWTSAFGFLPSGQANLELDEEGVSHLKGWQGSTSELLANWRPFQILDPFVFMMGGDKGGFVEMKRSK